MMAQFERAEVRRPGGRDHVRAEVVRDLPGELLVVECGGDGLVVDGLQQHWRTDGLDEVGTVVIAGVVDIPAQVVVLILDPDARLGAEGAIVAHEVCLTGVPEAEQRPILPGRHHGRQRLGRDLGDDRTEDVGTGSDCGSDEQHGFAAGGDVEGHIGEDRVADRDRAELRERTVDATDVAEVVADRWPRQPVGSEFDPLGDRVHHVAGVGVDQQEIGGAGVLHEIAQNRVVLGMGCAVPRTVTGVVEPAAVVEPVGVLRDVLVLDVPARRGVRNESFCVDVGSGLDEGWEELVVVDLGQTGHLLRRDVVLEALELGAEIVECSNDAGGGGKRRQLRLDALEAVLECLDTGVTDTCELFVDALVDQEAGEDEVDTRQQEHGDQ